MKNRNKFVKGFDKTEHLRFLAEWDNLCLQLKHSGYDLSKILLVPAYGSKLDYNNKGSVLSR